MLRDLGPVDLIAAAVTPAGAQSGPARPDRRRVVAGVVLACSIGSLVLLVPNFFLAGLLAVPSLVVAVVQLRQHSEHRALLRAGVWASGLTLAAILALVVLHSLAAR